MDIIKEAEEGLKIDTPFENTSDPLDKSGLNIGCKFGCPCPPPKKVDQIINPAPIIQ